MCQTMKIGSRVRVELDDTTDDWQECVMLTRRDGVTGTIIEEHNAHGHCFTVRHDDGVISAYEPHELYELDPLDEEDEDFDDDSRDGGTIFDP